MFEPMNNQSGPFKGPPQNAKQNLEAKLLKLEKKTSDLEKKVSPYEANIAEMKVELAAQKAKIDKLLAALSHKKGEV